MIKQLIALICLISMSPLLAHDAVNDGNDTPQECLVLTQEKLIGLTSKPDNELVFISNKCSYADFAKELKEKLQSALLKEKKGRLQLLLKDEKINIIMDTLATDHMGSTRFSYEDTKKIEDFYTSTKADTLKQSGSFEAFDDEISNDFYLVLFYTAEKDKLIVIYKRLTEVLDIPTEPTQPTDPAEPTDPTDGSDDSGDVQELL